MCTIKQCRAFFKAYDDVFLRGQINNPAEKVKVQAATRRMISFEADNKNDDKYTLTRRRNARIDGKAHKALKKQEIDDTKLLSKYQMALFTAHFRKGGKLDFDCIQTCFARFANGELRQGDRAREPNGPFFFYFAEFALLAVDAKVDAKDWTEIARTCIKVIEIFCEVYPPKKSNTPGLRPIDRPRKFKKKNQVKDAVKKKLHDKYEKMTLDQLKKEYEKSLKKSRDQKSVAMFIPKDKQGGQYASLDDRFYHLGGAYQKLIADGIASGDISEYAAGIISHTYNLFRNELSAAMGKLPFLGAPVANLQLGQYEAVAQRIASSQLGIGVQLVSVAIESHNIGDDWVIDFDLGGNVAELDEQLNNAGSPYEFQDNLVLLDPGRRQNGSIPVVINLVEVDPTYNDTGSISGELTLPTDGSSELQTISGQVKANRADTGYANFEFTFKVGALLA